LFSLKIIFHELTTLFKKLEIWYLISQNETADYIETELPTIHKIYGNMLTLYFKIGAV